MVALTLTASGLRRDFDRRPVVSDLSFTVRTGESLAVCGPNGSGKSTLLKMAAALVAPTAGSITLALDGAEIPPKFVHRCVGMVAPYLQVYEEFTAEENLMLVERLRGSRATPGERGLLLARVGLERRARDPVRTFSSGMTQRLKLALALMDRPPLLLLDEPGTNLDDDGRALLHQAVADRRGDAAVLVAANNREDASLGSASITLGRSAPPGGGTP